MDSTTLPRIGEVREAAARIAPHLHVTPLLTSRTLSEMSGVELHLKCENLQRTGSFKPRGAINRIATLDAADKRRGVITISAGNHAQGVAFAAARLGVDAVVVMPETASPIKVAATRGYGAECVLHGDVHAAFEKLDELRESRGLTFVHPFDDGMLIAGHGTVGLEILGEILGAGDCPGTRGDDGETAAGPLSFDAVVAGIGGGGLLSGIATAVRAISPETRIYGVEPVGAATMTAALSAGSVVRLDRVETIADGLAPPFVGEHNLRIVRQAVDRVVTVSDGEIGRAMALLLERLKLLVEPAGAAALAALLAGRLPIEAGSRVAVVLSGGNVDLDRLPDMLAQPAFLNG